MLPMRHACGRCLTDTEVTAKARQLVAAAASATSTQKAASLTRLPQPAHARIVTCGCGFAGGRTLQRWG